MIMTTSTKISSRGSFKTGLLLKMEICADQNTELWFTLLFRVTTDGRWSEGHSGDLSGGREASVSAIQAKYELELSNTCGILQF